MRVGIVSHIVNGKSGARAPIELAKSLSLKGQQITFYALDIDKDDEVISNLVHYGVKVSLINNNKIPIIGKLLNAINVKKAVQKDNIQILSLHCTMPFFIGCKLSGIPIIFTYHGTQYGILKEKFIDQFKFLIPLEIILNIIIWIRSAVYLWGSDKVIAISKYTQKEAKNMFNKYSEIIYLGAKPYNFNKICKNVDKKNECNLLSISRFTPYKNFHLLIKIFEKVKKSTNIPVKFTIVGSLGSKKYLDYLKSIAPKDVIFKVNSSDQELMIFYQNSDIYITADKYLFFGMPIVEAASFGKPTIAFNYCAAPELIETGNTGFVVKDVNECIKKICLLIENKELRKKMGTNAQGRMKKYFTWEDAAQKYIQEFKKVINEK